MGVLTMGPGEAVYERFGHNALLVEDKRAGRSVAWNYGLFEFSDDFIFRFLQGRMYYWMEAWPGRETIDAYVAAGRSVWGQDLRLTPDERAQLQAYLEWNALPANRTYLYDYYRENCSTKVRDALDRVLGGRLRQQLEGVRTGRTYRFHTQRANAHNAVLYTALYFVLGQPVDRPLSAWEECFLPEKLREHLRRVTRADGTPLVEGEWTVQGAIGVRETPPQWMVGFLLMGALIGGSLAGLAWGARRSRWARLGLAVLGGAWMGVVGCAGAVACGFWMFTTHVACYYNENILQMPPVALPLVVLVPALAYGRARRWAAALAWTVLGCSVLGLLLKALPAFYQVNGQMIALALPAHAGLVVAVWLLTRNRREAVVEADLVAKKVSRK